MKSETVRMVIGFAAVMVILVVWQLLTPQRRPQPPAQAAPAVQAEPAPVPVPAVAPAPVPAPTVPAGPETTLVIENEVLRVTVSSTGGALKSVFLKRYAAELVPAGSTLLGSPALLAAGSPRRLEAAVSGRQARLTYAAGADTVTRTLTIGGDYTLLCSLGFSGAARPVDLDASGGLATTERDKKEDLGNFHLYARSAGKVHQLSAGALRKKPFSGVADWAGLKTKYFLLAVIARAGTFLAGGKDLGDGRCGLSVHAAPDSSAPVFTIYAGPIEFNRLRAFRLGIENAVSLGWLKPIALGILWVIRVFYNVFRNWGVAIIFFSILMKGVFYPLTRTQTRQMRQMQLLQPDLNKLKEKYKGDPKLLNEETMRLYRLYKINPLSGCLPLLVQMPVFFALYAVLRTFIELRGAGFILWLKDLSQPDALFGHIPRGVPMIGGYAIGLLPILMGVSFIAQNFLTSTDKKNWALTILFPIFITAIFLNLSSGLQLYWFIYNVLSILESVITTRGGKLWRKPKGPLQPSPKAAGPPK